MSALIKLVDKYAEVYSDNIRLRKENNLLESELYDVKLKLSRLELDAEIRSDNFKTTEIE